MTETQTSCSACGDTGFVPPFMDPCDCPAGKPTVVAASLTIAPLGPLAVAPGTTCSTADGFMLVWTGSKWEPVATEALTAAVYAAKYGAEMVVIPRPSSGDPDFDELMAEANAWDAAQTPAGPEVGDLGPMAGTDEDDEAAAFAAAAADVDEVDAEAEFEVVRTDDVVTATMSWSEPLDPPYPTPLDEWHTPKPAPAPLEEAGWTPKPVHTMSPAQEALLAKLIAERDPDHIVVKVVVGTLASTSVSKSKASTLIDSLMVVPTDPTRKADRPNSYDGVCQDCGGAVSKGAGHIRKIDGRWKTYHNTGDCLSADAKAAMEADRVTEPGLYKADDDGVSAARVYRVRPSRTTKRLYAELVVPHSDGTVDFAYNGKAMAWLRSSDRLTWAEARDFGAAYGACVACGRTLSDARSLVQGYGATCAARYSWPTVTAKQAEAIIDGDLTWDDVISL